MRCDDFQRRFDRLLDDGDHRPERDGQLTALTAHAAQCDRCGDAAELLDLLSVPRRERDDVEDPGAAYWASFNGRLRDRIEARGAARPRAPSLAARRGAWVGLAASLAVVLIGGWLVIRAQRQPAPRAAGTSEGARVADHGPDDVWSEAPSTGELTWAGGWGGVWEPAPDDGPGLYPDLDGLDAEARRALLASLTTDDS